ncbi:hypothetical protein N7449_001263 [Penicillium cf. viridicatum]|uniref:O-methyltransferase domain-containing protein n=1 Tax=Penicillium cf. viridicatum TaxID=2972119 RepID=A0A9W9N6H5_9EURO|nr:hypothetical protein N7449_001263 [Penicillium cf. viridicatum]
MASPSVSVTLDGIATSRAAFDKNEAGPRDALIDQSCALIAALEIPSEFVQRTFWAEPAQSAIICIAVDVKLFQHLKDAGDAGLTLSAFSQKTATAPNETSGGNEPRRRTINIVSISAMMWRALHLTDSRNISKSPNIIPRLWVELTARFKRATKQTSRSTPPHLQHFDSFMSAYHADKPNWHEFHPVAERLTTGFDASICDVLLVDVGGGKGHDVATFAPQNIPCSGRIVLHDREPVIADIYTYPGVAESLIEAELA